jgi:hypothetical protein
MTDLQHIPPAMQRRQLLEVIEHEQQKAWKKLREAGFSEAHALAVMPRIRSYGLFALNEYDQAYLAFEEMVVKEGRSLAHQQFIADKAAFLLRSIEAGIAELVAHAIRQAIKNAQQPPAGDVIPAVRYEPRPPAWQTVLATTFKLLIWLLAMPASYLLTSLFTGWDIWAVIGPISLFVLWLMVRFSWWGLLFPVTALGGALLLFY